MIYDPRPLDLRQPDPQAIETLRYNLLAINRPCGFLVPSVEKVMHDHSYGSQVGDVPIGVADDPSFQ